MDVPAASASAFAPPRPRPARSPRWSSATAHGRARQRQVRRVLVVDDDPDILASLAPVLEGMLGVAVDVETARSGEEARRRIEAGDRYDLVLTDERMPGMRGSELLAWLRAAQPEAARVLMSAFYEGYAARDLAEQSGAALFVRKPFDLPAMLAGLRRLLAGSEEEIPPA